MFVQTHALDVDGAGEGASEQDPHDRWLSCHYQSVSSRLLHSNSPIPHAYANKFITHVSVAYTKMTVTRAHFFSTYIASGGLTISLSLLVCVTRGEHSDVLRGLFFRQYSDSLNTCVCAITGKPACAFVVLGQTRSGRTPRGRESEKARK